MKDIVIAFLQPLRRNRISRMEWWGYEIVIFMFICFVAALCGVTTHEDITPAWGQIINYAFLFPSAYVSTKRFQDLNSSPYFSLTLFIPGLNILIMIFILGFTSGSNGTNRYGDDPLLDEENEEDNTYGRYNK